MVFFGWQFSLFEHVFFFLIMTTSWVIARWDSRGFESKPNDILANTCKQLIYGDIVGSVLRLASQTTYTM